MQTSFYRAYDRLARASTDELLCFLLNSDSDDEGDGSTDDDRGRHHSSCSYRPDASQVRRMHRDLSVVRSALQTYTCQLSRARTCK
jgi:hypothetical protein